MDDTASIDLINKLHPKLRQRAFLAYGDAVASTPVGIHPVINQTYRSFAESDYDYQLGRTVANPDGQSKSKPLGDIISYAKGGTSWHNYGLALDFYLLKNGKATWVVDDNWMIVVDCFKAYGFNWGGEFPDLKDYPHLEHKMGQTLTTLLQLHIEGKIIPGTPYVNF